MKTVLKKICLLTVLLSLCMTAVPCTAQAAGSSKGINVKYHSKSEIRRYLKAKKIDINEKVKYSKAPKLKAPYSAGKVDKKSLKSALRTLNAIRYIAGINDNIKLDDNYTKKAQAAALINCVNNSMSHYPAKPSGMSQSFYQLCYSGAGSSNLATSFGGPAGLNYPLVRMWMYDGDKDNIPLVGHRRWVLNPPMKKTGFGFVSGTEKWPSSYSAMYAIDNAFGKSSYYGVAWPAQNMPLEFFGDSYPWSISMGRELNADKVKVVLTRKKDGKKWTFSKNNSKYGYFNVENNNYGAKGCIIFRPNNISYRSGDQFQVKITGAGKAISYQVNFFSL